MNKNAGRGLLALLLWASLLTLMAFLFFEDRPGSPKDLLRGLPYAVPLLFAGFYILAFLALKGRRLRLLGFLAAGLALSFFLAGPLPGAVYPGRSGNRRLVSSGLLPPEFPPSPEVPPAPERSGPGLSEGPRRRKMPGGAGPLRRSKSPRERFQTARHRNGHLSAAHPL